MAAFATTAELGCEIWIELHEQLPHGHWNEFSCVTKSTEVQQTNVQYSSLSGTS